MILAGWIAGSIAVAWLAVATWLSRAQRISFRQAVFLAPLAVLWRIDARALRKAFETRSVIYVVSHQSRLDAALMLSLLPEDTLHILDEKSAAAGWMEPWRALARTIAFNPEHLFVNRRLARMLRGGGRLCVYLPADIRPDSRTFRLYRAVARIARRAEAKVVPVHVEGASSLPFPLRPREGMSWSLLPKLVVRALEPATIGELIARNVEAQSTSSTALYERLQETRAGDNDSGLGNAA